MSANRTTSDDLIARAKAASEGVIVPESWGEVVELEEGGGVFVGRYRGQEEDSRGESIFLFWDEDDEPRFFWPAYRLKQGMERDNPAIGDTVCVYRDENYTTRYDDESDASGLAYGVAVEPNGAPLPADPTAEPLATTATPTGSPADNDLPF